MTRTRGERRASASAVGVRSSLLVALAVGLGACAGSRTDPGEVDPASAGPEAASGGEQPNERSAPPRAAADPSLEACALQPISALLAVLRCPGFELKIMRPVSAHGRNFDEYLRDPGWSRGELALAGRTFPVGRFNADGAHGSRAGLIVLHETPQQVYALSCFSDRALDPELRQCRAALAHVIEHGLPANVRFAETSLVIGDTTLRVPEGCRLLEQAERIRCPQGELNFSHPSRRPDQPTPEKIRAWLARGLSAIGRVEQTRIACRVLGKDQTCDAFSVMGPDGVRFRVVAAIDDPEAPALQCSMASEPLDHYPAPCDQVFEGRPR